MMIQIEQYILMLGQFECHSMTLRAVTNKCHLCNRVGIVKILKFLPS